MLPAMSGPAVVAIIPARGGSKGVPGKNVRPVGGRPLIARAIDALLAADGVDVVVVSTDDTEIATVARDAGAQVVDRPTEIAGDTATSESALLHALDVLAAHGGEPEVTVFVQATSPFIDPADVSRGVAAVRSGANDVAFSVAESHVFLWRETADGAEGVNHDKSFRPRRQDREPEYAETGAFYVMRTAGFREAGHRFFGRVAMIEVSPRTAVEIDTEDDLALVDALVASQSVAQAAAQVLEPIPARAVVTDFDGVHTDDTATVDQDGREAVRVSRSDGMGIELLRKAGVPVLILSKEKNPVVLRRAEKLKVEVVSGEDDKETALRAWAKQADIDLSDVAYLGNDVNDVAPLGIVGWPIVVADAHPTAKAAARIVLSAAGGRGAVRELADRVLAAR